MDTKVIEAKASLDAGENWLFEYQAKFSFIAPKGTYEI